MNTDTGRFYEAEEVKKLPLRERRHLRELSDSEADEVRTMNRAQRRAWAARNRKR